MTRKFKIAQPNNNIDPSVTKAVNDSTPLVHSFAELIMSNYTKAEDTKPLGAIEQSIQDLFDKWPSNDLFTKRMAEFTEIMLDFKPKLKGNDLKFGKLYKMNDTLWVVIHNNGGTFYGVNASLTNYTTISQATETGEGTVHYVSLAEVGEFAKALLSTKGETLLNYVVKTFGAPGLAALLANIGEGIV